MTHLDDITVTDIGEYFQIIPRLNIDKYCNKYCDQFGAQRQYRHYFVPVLHTNCDSLDPSSNGHFRFSTAAKGSIIVDSSATGSPLLLRG